MSFEFYERSLEDEIEEKKNFDNENYFSEPEIWYICDSLINAERTFIENGYVHADI